MVKHTPTFEECPNKSCKRPKKVGEPCFCEQEEKQND